ncbi:diacylglycerol kinase, partial [Bifidobacterium pseudocatenulatum]|nr:diacylglycerol kinase [Bifidobacterium pseudocatenulatum]
EGDEPPGLMAVGEYVGRVAVQVVVQDRALRVLVPPGVAESQAANTDEKVLEAIMRDHRDPVTGKTDT